MTRTLRYVAAAAAALVVFAGPSRATLYAQDVATVAEVATGLNDPRGLAFGPDKHLYVAEAGSGGATLSTVGLCDQVEPPVGPFLAGNSARVLRISPWGEGTVVADGLPSAEATPLVGGDKQGASAVAFNGNRLLTLIAGGGCSHGHADADNAILELGPDGVSQFVNLSAWLLANPGGKGELQPRDPDYEPDGVWYSLLFDQGRLYAVEPNHGLLVSVHPEHGDVTLVNDLYTTFGDRTYTALAADRGDLYIGTLGRFVWTPGVFPPVPDFVESFRAGIYRLSRNGTATQVGTGLYAVLGVAFDRQHRLYALQSPIFAPGSGSLVRQVAYDQWETIVSGLDFPSALTLGPDGAFYISECGYHCAAGAGRILRVTIP